MSIFVESDEALLEQLIYYRGLGYTQEEIQDRMDISQQTLSRWFAKIKELEKDGQLYVAVTVDFERIR